MRRWAAVASVGLLLVATGCPRRSDEPPYAGEPFLAVWAGDDDRRDSDFLAVIDVDPRSRSYATVVHTVPVGSRGNEPQGLGPARADGRLLAAGVRTSRIFAFDVRLPREARLFHVENGGPTWTHQAPTSIVGRRRGRLFATCPDRTRYRGTPREVLDAPGGLVALDSSGHALAELSGASRQARAFIIAPTDGVIVPGARLIVTTNRGHGFATTTETRFMPGIAVQVWSAPERRLMATLVLEVGDRGDENLGPDAIAVLHGRPVVFVATADGGALYAASFIGATMPVFRLVHDFGPGSRPSALAVTPDDRFLVAALAGTGEIVVFDLANPYQPREIDDEDLPGDEAAGPGAIAVSADGSRIAVATYGIDVPALREDGSRRVLLMRLDRTTGTVRLDRAFADERTGEPGLDFRRLGWPHGPSGPARPAGLRFIAPILGER